MIFYIVAQSPEDFEAWVATESEPAEPPDAPSARRGQDVFLSSTCVGCHAVRGTDAEATLGPDLTHLATRATIAAGVLANTRGNLARFITDPQHVKPGATMPPTELTDDQLNDLLDYLEQLD